MKYTDTYAFTIIHTCTSHTRACVCIYEYIRTHTQKHDALSKIRWMLGMAAEACAPDGDTVQFGNKITK